MFVIKLFMDMISFVFGFIHKYILELIMMMFVTLFTLWGVTYIMNGMYGYHFDLNSCWNGFGAIGGAGVLAAIKYCTDSWKNTVPGEMPGQDNNPVDKFVGVLKESFSKRGERRDG